jgi:hypothetical protein
VEKELVISSTSTEVEIALIENAHLVEIHSQKVNKLIAYGFRLLEQGGGGCPSLHVGGLKAIRKKKIPLYF